MDRVPILVLIGLLMLVPPVAAHSETHDLTYIGTETGCPSGSSMCFKLVEGSTEDIGPGDQVHITFRNEGKILHMFMATTPDKADPQHQATPEDAALPNGGIEDVQPGETGQTTFTVPAQASGLYFWCGVPGHEASGMWLQIEFDGSGDKSTPMPGTFAILAVLGLAALLRRK